MDGLYAAGCSRKRHYHYREKHLAKVHAKLMHDGYSRDFFVCWCPACRGGWIVASADDKVGRGRR